MPLPVEAAASLVAADSPGSPEASIVHNAFYANWLARYGGQ